MISVVSGILEPSDSITAVMIDAETDAMTIVIIGGTGMRLHAQMSELMGNTASRA